MNATLIRRLLGLTLLTAAPAALAGAPPLWTDFGSGFAPLFEVTLSRLDDVHARRVSEGPELWTDAATGFKALFEHPPYQGPAEAAPRGSPDGV